MRFVPETKGPPPPGPRALDVTYPVTTQEMAVPKKAYVKIDPKF